MSVRARNLALVAFFAGVTGNARAQGVAEEAALYLLVPVGAQMIGQGQAGVASRLGPGGFWSNPAALGWMTKRELSTDYASNGFIAGSSLGYVYPAGRAGVLGLSVLYYSLGGDQPVTDPSGTPVGTTNQHATVLGGTYAATFGDRVSAGVTYKYIRQDIACSGLCPDQAVGAISTTAVDLGAHVVVDSARRLTVGAALRNYGFGLQTIDQEQTDPLPTRVHVGADYEIAAATRAVPGLAVHVVGEVVTTSAFDTYAFHAGAEARYADAVVARAGLLSGSPDGSFATFGLGLRRNWLSIDFAQSLGGTAADAGLKQAYITVRISFR